LWGRRDRWKRVVIVDIVATEFHDSRYESHPDHPLQGCCAEWRSHGDGGVARTEACAAEEDEYTFTGVDQLIEDFIVEVEQWKSEH
jgi:hypothetical protein